MSGTREGGVRRGGGGGVRAHGHAAALRRLRLRLRGSGLGSGAHPEPSITSNISADGLVSSVLEPSGLAPTRLVGLHCPPSVLMLISLGT